jgi:hypothetical protein
MKKIAKIIEECIDCENCVFAYSVHKEHNFSICSHPAQPPFILNHSSDDPKHYKLEIPNNCPLEDYDTKCSHI